MSLALDPQAAGWFALFALPISLLVGWNDLARMKIPNTLVMALVAVYAVVGVLVLPLETYLWGYAHLVVVLLAGMVLNFAGAVGAGDAKFVAAAAPFVHLADLQVVLMIFLAALLTGFAVHRLAKHSPVRRLVPHWESWNQGARFPMGIVLGATLSIYLIMCAFNPVSG